MHTGSDMEQASDFGSEFNTFLAASHVFLDQPTGTIGIPGHRRVTLQAKHREMTTMLLLSFLIDKLRPTIFLDIGAAGGDISCVAASHEASPPTVHAFEMRPTAVAEMRERLADEGLTHRVAVHLAGLSDAHVGETDIWFSRTRLHEREPDRHEWQEAWWRRLKFALRGQSRGLQKVSVLLTSVDHFCAERGLVPDLVKIDVDGYEGKVLQGGLRTFSEHRPVIMLELHKDKLIRFGETRREVVARLFNIGYRAIFLTDHHDPKSCRVVPVDLDDPLIARQETDLLLFH